MVGNGHLLDLYASDHVDLVVANHVLYVAWREHFQMSSTSSELVFESSCNPSLGLAALGGEKVLVMH